MKIIQIIPNLKKGGAERLVLDLSIALNALPNIELVLLTFQEGNEYTFLSETIKHQFIPSSFTPSILGKPQTKIDELQKFINEFQPDIIHSHLFETEILLSQINYSSAKRFVHFHDQMPQFKKIQWSEIFKKNTWTNWYERNLVLSRYDKQKTLFIPVSNNTLQYIQKNLASFESTLLLNGINLKRFKNNPNSFNSNRISIIGSLVEKKNQVLAIKVLHELKIKGFEYHLDIIGDGPLKTELMNFVQQLSLESLVHFHGLQNHPEKFQNDSFLYIHTAKYEPFGLVLIEAMASGLPVVCTNGGGNAELIENGKNGYCLDEFNAKALAEKIIYLKEQKEVYENMKLEAINYAKKFDINEYTQKLLDLYKAS